MTLTVHGLLHIADTIERIGPVWTWWSFPIERQCGHLKRHITDKRHPFSNLDNYIILAAQSKNAKLIYNIANEDLSLDEPVKEKKGLHLDDECTCFFCTIPVGWTSCCSIPDGGIILHGKVNKGHPKGGDCSNAIRSCLVTRFNLTNKKARDEFWERLPQKFEEYRQMTIANGDRIRAASHQGPVEEDTDHRDATFVRVSGTTPHIHLSIQYHPTVLAAQGRI